MKILNQVNPECPLCSKSFERVFYNGRDFYICKRDDISIDVNDPMLMKWDNHKELNIDVSCPNPRCRNKMNFFCRSDGYVKAACPVCKAGVETEEVEDGFYHVEKGKGELILEDGE